MPAIAHIPGLNKVTRFAAILAKSFAFSRTINPRNLEHHWYPLWSRFLNDLVSDIPNLLVFPQYPIWVVAENVAEPESHIEGDDLEPPSAEQRQADKKTRAKLLRGAREAAYKRAKEEKDRKKEQESQEQAAKRKARFENRQKTREKDEEERKGGTPNAPSPDAPTASTSKASDPTAVGLFSDGASAQTIPTPYARGRYADFAIVSVKAAAHAENPERYDGWRVLEDHVPLLVEVKRSPSRDAQGLQFRMGLDVALSEASSAVLIQAAYLFASRPQLAMVVAIAAAGPYWMSAVILREHEFTDDELNIMMHDMEYRPEEELVGKPIWSQPLKLYTPESDEAMEDIRNEVLAFNIMTAPEWP
ncbi:hypothetical protein BV25DRAFT_1339522 [Artomyces pyxidatus]|uniref:Uncharacterized protein n=1 Tax=Artomyces pyxidatus TaxID=48021 RepID=A0ACB8SNC4_9AGAM|nr:hypothetical protein BV25DRAFT_1339522 [Artomyces pyxidatus]